MICQSCGMPITEDKNKGTNRDGSKSEEYCIFCFDRGEFIEENLTLEQQTQKLIKLAVTNLEMNEEKARELANNTLSKLKRWKEQ